MVSRYLRWLFDRFAVHSCPDQAGNLLQSSLQSVIGADLSQLASLHYLVTMRGGILELTLISVSLQGAVNGFMPSVPFLKTKYSKENTWD